jgi:hypothetical protein
VLEQGPTEKSIIEQCVRSRLPLPPRIASAPELGLGLDLFYTAFVDLSSCRTMGMAEGPIPWLAVRSYCREQRIIGDQREDLHYHINKLDAVYLEYRAKTIKTAAPTNDRPARVRKKDGGNGPRG